LRIGVWTTGASPDSRSSRIVFRLEESPDPELALRLTTPSFMVSFAKSLVIRRYSDLRFRGLAEAREDVG